MGQSQSGKGSLPFDHPQCLGAVGSTGTTAANAVARAADVVIRIGTRYSDFTTASRTAFANPDVRFVNINLAPIDVVKHSGATLLADAREALVALTGKLSDHHVGDDYIAEYTRLDQTWQASVEAAYHPTSTVTEPGVLTQSEVLGLVNDLSDPRDVVVCAAGSLPGDLHNLWQVRDPQGYHVEYGYSCLGYEIAGGLGVRMACPDRGVFVMVGDGSYLMMATELVGYLHLKQVDPDIVKQVEAEDLTFPEAVRRGVMCEPPSGLPTMGPVLDAVGALGRDLYAIVEQDLYPCPPEQPLPIARRTHTYLASCSSAPVSIGTQTT